MKKIRLFCLLLGCACIGYALADFSTMRVTSLHAGQVLQTAQKMEQQPSSVEMKENSLKEYNEDYVCWLKMKEPFIQLPVVETQDNSYYLDHAFDHCENDYGTPFFASHTNRQDAVRVIYGHHIYFDDTAMFSPLMKLLHQQEGSFSLTYDSQEEIYDITHVMHVPKMDGTFPMSKTEFTSDEDFAAWIDYANAHNAWTSSQGCTPSDTYVLLQTCDSNRDNFLVVIGKKRVSLVSHP